ncbi:LysR family transcriptional regulator [Singulisphaera rosea]
MADKPQRFKEFNLTQLRIFCEFLQQKSFADTARTMNLSHSGVWQQVRALERKFGVSLLQRHGRAWSPTEDGQALFDLISDLLRSVDSLEEVFRQLRGDIPRELRVIATPGSTAGELIGPITEIKRSHPSTKVCVSLGASLEQTEKDLLSGAADLAVVTGSLVGNKQRSSLEMIVLSQRPSNVLVPTRHPLTRRTSITLADLVEEPLIMPPSMFLWRQKCDDVFRVAGLIDRLKVTIEVSLFQAIEEFVRRKLGIGLTALVPDWKPGPGVVKIPVGHLIPPDQLYLLRRRGKPRPQAQLLEDLLLESSRSARVS